MRRYEQRARAEEAARTRMRIIEAVFERLRKGQAVAVDQIAQDAGFAQAPHARRAHPSPEHFLPLYVALGAAGEGAPAARIHRGFTLGGLSMSAFRFAPAA